MTVSSKRFVTKVLASALTVGALSGPVATYAQDFDALINDTIVQIEGLSATQAELHQKLQAAYQEIEKIQGESAEISKAIAEDTRTLKEIEEEIAVLEETIANREQLLEEQARAVQVSNGSANYLNYVASSKSVTDLVGRVDVINRMVSANKDLIQLQIADKEAVETKHAQAVETLEAKEAKQKELETAKVELATQTASQEEAYNQLTNDITLAAAQRDALVVEREQYLEQQRLAYEAQLAQEAAANQASLEASVAAASQATSEAELQAQYNQALAEAQAQDAAIAQAQAEADQAAAEAEQARAYAQQAEAAAQEAEANVGVVQEAAPETLTQEPVEVEQVEPEMAWESVEETEAPVEETEAVVEEVETEQSWTAVTPEEAQAAREEAERAKAAAAEAEAANQVAQANVQSLISFAEQFIGTPYVWGGKQPGGFDCSGYVYYVFQQVYGINVGGWTGEQQNSGSRIGVGEAQAGDLYFWSNGEGAPYHVALATGNGNYLHAVDFGRPLSYGTVSDYFMPSFAVRVNK